MPGFQTLLRRADYLPSSLDLKAEERKYVSDVLKVNGYAKTFLHNFQKPVTTSNTPDEKERATGFAVIPYIQGVTEPIKRILNSLNVKAAQKPFQTFGAYFSQTYGSCQERKTNRPYLFYFPGAMTVITSISHRPNISLVHV